MKIYNYVLYDSENGQIIQYGIKPVDFILPSNTDKKYTKVDKIPSDIENYYIVNDELTLRPELYIDEMINLKIDQEYYFVDIPENTSINIPDVFEDIVDNNFTISFPISGDYELSITPPFPFIAKKVNIFVSDK